MEENKMTKSEKLEKIYKQRFERVYKQGTLDITEI
jgi:hypothetical protein